MPINKVVYGNTTILDLSNSTLDDASKLLSGVTAYDRAGNLITGTATTTGNEWTSGIYQDASNYIKISPLAAAGGAKLVNGYIELSATQAGSGSSALGTKTITENGTYNASADSLDGYSSVTVNVSGGASPTLQSKSVDPSTSQQTITPDSGYDGLSSVEISAIQTQTKSATPSESAQTITPDSGKYLTSVSVGAVSNTYVGSGITKRTSSDITTSGATVSVPAGYYAEAASKSIASGSATVPTTTITANPSISVDANGLITATASASQNVMPTVSAGYVSSGTAGTVTVSGSVTEQLTTKAAATYTPSTSTQTIAAGQYLTGAQTINPIPSNYITTDDASATASDINSGATAYVNGVKVTGTQVIQHYYTGSSEPAVLLGDDGDIYLKVVS